MPVIEPHGPRWGALCLAGLMALALGCEEKQSPKPAPSASAATATASGAATATATATSTATHALPPLRGADEITHLEPQKANDAKCPPLPKTGDGEVNKLARSIHLLACTPELYYRPAAEVREGLDLPPGVTFRFGGPRSATLERPSSAPSLAASELAAALGIASPVITTASSGAWATRLWYLGSNAKTGKLDQFPPALVNVSVSHGTHAETVGEIKPLGDESIGNWIGVTMPQDVVPVKDDMVAVALYIRAAAKLAAEPHILAQEPADAAKALGVDGERFRVSRRAIGTGESAIKGIDIWTARTQVGATAIIRALGLSGEIEHERAQDSNDYVLYRDGEQEHAWKGLKVTPSFSPRDGIEGSPKSSDDYTLDGISFMP